MKQDTEYFLHGKIQFVKKEDFLFLTMFPRVPRQQYIDKIQGQDLPAAVNHNYDKEQQDIYESEVIVFRNERLKSQNLLVLHSVKYNHFQYRMRSINQNTKTCNKC